MLERSAGLADRSEHQHEELEGISQNISGNSSDQSDKLGYFFRLDSHHRSWRKKIFPFRLHGKVLFLSCCFTDASFKYRFYFPWVLFGVYKF
jgi:hypothetical protein